MNQRLKKLMKENPGDILFLCGAGISLDAPTSVPTVNRFIHDVLEESGISSETIDIEFWRTFGFEGKKLKFLAALEQDGVLCRSMTGDTEIYYIAYNLLDDYWKAKVLEKSDKGKDELINYLLQYVLKVDNGMLGDWSGITVAAIACCLREDKTSEDYIEQLLQYVREPQGQKEIVVGYLETYHWRNCNTFSAERFFEFIHAHHVASENLWPILIANSTKEKSPIKHQCTRGTNKIK